MVSPERGEEERCFQKEGRGKIAPPARSPLPPLNPETQIISTQADETIHMLVITALPPHKHNFLFCVPESI